MTARLRQPLTAAVIVCGLALPSVQAAVPPQSPLAEKVVRHPDLSIPTALQPARELRDALGARIREDLAALGVGGDSAFYDARAGRLTSFILSEPLVPGDGVGNALPWGARGRPATEEALQDAAWNALRAFVQDRQALLKVDVAELGAPRIDVFEDGNLIQVHSPRMFNGIPVRDSALTAVINHGNLILLGLDHWGDAPRREGVPALGDTQAQLRVAQHASPFDVESIEKGGLEYIPMARGDAYEYRLAWSVRVRVVGDVGSWEGLVDAASGELIAFEDRNQYARKVMGGVYPVSNDQRPPDGIEQPGWPMPLGSIIVNGTPLTTSTGGTFGCPAGTVSFALAGPFVRMNDSCGAANEMAATIDLDLGFGPAPADTDCVVPAGHSAGDTKSSRSGFYELNRIVEQAKGYLPANAWLNQQLTSNMNLPQTCNAFWNGATVNFFRSAIAQGCRNTGEIAAIFDHEWGHGLDDNNANGAISRPGEAIADIVAAVRLNTSCIGRGFFINQVCGGYGDACDGNPATGCTGVRDIDFMNHRCNQPHTISWAQSGFTSAQCGGTGSAPACPAGGGTPCGRETHCEGYIAAETSWDLYARDLQAAPFLFDSNTALELATRIVYLGSNNLGDWYTCAAGCQTAGTCGCNATGGYLLYLAADDDNGNINDGTPHMTAIRAAFERHQIHCATPAPLNSGCVGGPALAPVVTATAGAEAVNLSWTAVPDAARYFVYRTEGVSACNFGKIKIADVTGTSFSDTLLQGGRSYSYIVLPVGANTSCFGRASACASATPTTVACALADFTLSCAPSTLTVPQGGSGQSTCTIGSVNAFSAPVTLSCTGLPAGVTCAYNPPAPTPPANGTTPSTLTVTVGGVVPPATYNFQAQGASGGTTHTFAMTLNVSAVSVAPQALAVDAATNGVFQPNETVVMAPTWRNTGAGAVTLTGATSSFIGPAGGAYTNPDNTAAYGMIAAGGQAACTDCYTVRATAATRPLTHWDSTILETVNPSGTTKNWTLHIGDSFTDVLPSSGFYRFVETILHKNVTGGCTTTTYCPLNSTTREQMAVFVLVSKEAPGYLPPACSPPNMFTDVPETSPFCRWIEELANRGVVGGCAPGLYCPSDPATREQMAVFVLRTLDPTLNPPACAPPNLFADVPETSPFCKWIEELANRGVVTGCGGGNYCPTANVTREQMSVFLAATFGLVLYGL